MVECFAVTLVLQDMFAFLLTNLLSVRSYCSKSWRIKSGFSVCWVRVVESGQYILKNHTQNMLNYFFLSAFFLAFFWSTAGDRITNALTVLFEEGNRWCTTACSRWSVMYLQGKLTQSNLCLDEFNIISLLTTSC